MKENFEPFTPKEDQDSYLFHQTEISQIESQELESNGIITKQEIISKDLIKVDNWLEPLTEKITLIKVIDQSFYEGHLVLKNKLNQYIVFKFNNYKPCYSITPILYFIKPMEQLTINIKRFEKLELSSQIKVNDCIHFIAAQASGEIEDVNDARIFLRKDDIYSPEFQLYKLPIELDNGNNMRTYRKIIEERKTILNEYNRQLNMNNVTSCDEVRKHIESVKREIEDYEDKINNLLSKLGDMNKNNIIKQPEVIFDVETFRKVHREERGIFIKESIPRSVLIFLICVCLFIGKIIKIMTSN